MLVMWATRALLVESKSRQGESRTGKLYSNILTSDRKDVAARKPSSAQAKDRKEEIDSTALKIYKKSHLTLKIVGPEAI